MRIVTVPCRSDNYAYLVICERTGRAAVVDPSQADPVLAAIEAEGVSVAAVWNTHHHFDHVEGNAAVAKKYSGCEIVAHETDRDRIPGQTRFVGDGEVLTVGEQVRAEVIFNPGHTSGAISYYLEAPGAVFTGDTLFAAGCGRLFEGSAEQMHASLQRLVALPAETQVYCGHEYTESNLRFCLAVEPENVAIQERVDNVRSLREQGKSTMGFTIAEELATNVFVRTSAGVFANLRSRKDTF